MPLIKYEEGLDCPTCGNMGFVVDTVVVHQGYPTVKWKRCDWCVNALYSKYNLLRDELEEKGKNVDLDL